MTVTSGELTADIAFMMNDEQVVLEVVDEKFIT